MSKLFIPTKRPNAIKQIDILKQKTSRKEKIEHEVKFYEKMNKIKNQKQYNISGIISYRIINTDKSNNRGPSSMRTKNVSFITPLMFKSDITKEYIQFGFEDDINIIGQESGTEIEFEPISNININELTSVNLNNIPMGSKKLSIKCLEQSDGINTNPGQCVIDNILYELSNKKYFLSFTRKDLIKSFKGTTATTDQIIEFAKLKNYVSVYALDPLNNIFNSYVAEDSKYSLTFIVNNNHLYPILDANLKKSISVTKKIQLNDYKFNISYDDYQYLETVKDEINLNSRVILLNNDNKEFYNDKENTDDVIYKFLNKAMKDTDEKNKSYVVDSIKFYNGRVQAFKHPITNQIYEITSDFTERKNIIDDLTKKYGPSLIKFENQSYTTISQIIYNNEFGNIKLLESNLSDNIYNLFQRNIINAFQGNVSEDLKEDKNSYGVDIIKSYSSVLLYNDTEFNIFQPFDEVQLFNESMPLKPGEYYINIPIMLCDGLMQYPKGYYPLHFIKFLLNNNIITKSNIKMVLYAKQYLKSDTFKNFTEFIYSNYEPSQAKKIINFFIGSLGSKYIKSDSGCITSSYEIACALLLQYQDNHKINIDSLNDLHFVRLQNKQPKYTNSLSIHRHIICGGIINLVNLYNSIRHPNIKIISFNTDCIFVKTNLFILDRVKLCMEPKNEIETLGKYKMEPYHVKSNNMFIFEDRAEEFYKKIEWNEIEEDENINETMNNINSCLISGIAGSGKTELIKNIYNEETDLILSFTNNSIINIKERLQTEDNIYTFDSFFNENLTFEQKIMKSSKFERILIDEYSMTPYKMMNLLNVLKNKLNIKLFFFGDYNQCLSVETTGIIYDYFKSSTFQAMCNNNLINLKYKPEYARYNQELKDILDLFLKNDKAILPILLKTKTEQNTYINICRTINKKWQINKSCNERYLLENPNNTKLEITYKKTINNKLVDIPYILITGQEYICSNKIASYNLYNGSRCKLENIECENILLKYNNDLIKFNIKEFIENFEPAYAQTIYRFQGLTIREPFTIHELNIMSKRELYTSMSRATKLDDICFNYTSKYFENKDIINCVELKMKKNNDIDEKYQHGKIYKITFDNFIYIGSTYRDIEERFKEHKQAKKGSIFIEKLKDNKNKAKIELVMKYPCKSLQELEFKEREITEQYINHESLILLNTKFNRKQKIKNSQIDIQRLEKINTHEHLSIFDNIEKKVLRFKNKDVDIKISYNKHGKEETFKKLKEKIIEKIGMENNEFIIVF